MTKATVALRLDSETQQRLKTLGEARDRSTHYLMKQAVEQFLAVEEGIEREKELMHVRWERFELTGESIEQAEVRSLLDTLKSEAKAGDAVNDG
ncbi:MAG: toxin-antitoxin system [Alphaproteobacteria bacterium]|nr:toxin-antitoxin system [Alphaproteobacteria bacterium]